MRKIAITLTLISLLVLSTSSIAGWQREAWDAYKDTVTKAATGILKVFVSPSLASEDVEGAKEQVSTLQANLKKFDIDGERPNNFNEVQEMILGLKQIVTNLDGRVTTLESKVHNLEVRLSTMSTSGSAVNQALPAKERSMVLMLIKPSFKCSKAKEDIEISICQSLVLRDIDGRLGEIYWDLRAHFPNPTSLRIKNEQLEWLKKRDAQCDAYDEKCLVAIYKERILELKARF